MRERTLLLGDDEENILTALLLRRDGYRILTVPSGNASLEVLAQNEANDRLTRKPASGKGSTLRVCPPLKQPKQ